MCHNCNSDGLRAQPESQTFEIGLKHVKMMRSVNQNDVLDAAQNEVITEYIIDARPKWKWW